MVQKTPAVQGMPIIGNARVLGTLRPGFCGQKPMLKKASVGLQDSGTKDELTTEKIRCDICFTKPIEQHKETYGSEITSTSAAEDGARTSCLIESRKNRAGGAVMQCSEFLQAADAAAGSAAGDITDTEITAQQTWLPGLADDADDERWCYETTQSHVYVRSELMNALCEEPSGTVEMYSLGRGGVPLGFEVSTADNMSIETLMHLSAEQAEALAVDLLEQAHTARKDTDD